jgi:hypothetical protein
MLDIVGNLFLLINYCNFSESGKEIYPVYLSSTIIKFVSHYIISCLVVFMGWGWTILYQNLNEYNDILIPIFAFLGIFQLTVQAVCELFQDSQDILHQLNGGYGLLFTLIRITIFIYFYMGI